MASKVMVNLLVAMRCEQAFTYVRLEMLRWENPADLSWDDHFPQAGAR
jgi:hypothetical protein